MVLYRDLRRAPVSTLDGICAFLGVGTGVVATVPAENVTAAAAQSRLDRAIGYVLPALDRLPAAVRAPVTTRVRRRLQREQRTPTPLTAAERSELLPVFDEDSTLLEKLTGCSSSTGGPSRPTPGRRWRSRAASAPPTPTSTAPSEGLPA